MPTLLDITRCRFSCRSFQPQLPSDEQLAYIKQCVRIAPSAVNRQPWRFYFLTGSEPLRKIARCYQRDWIRTAPMVVMATLRHDEEWVRKWDNTPHGRIDVSIAIEHLCLAASEQNLATCWVCAFDAQLCHSLFSLPEEEEIIALIPIGFPTQQALETARTERKPENQVFFEINS